MSEILDKMQFRGNRVLVSPIEEKKESNIITPDSAKPEIIKGLCIKKGDGAEIVKGVEEGATLWYEKGRATPMAIDDTPYFLIDGKNAIVATI